MKDKWEVLVKFDDDTKKGISKKLINILQNKNKKYNSDTAEYEISVIQKDNKHGHTSWGWGDKDKIILFDRDVSFESKQDMQWAVEVAKTLSDALNKNNL